MIYHVAGRKNAVGEEIFANIFLCLRFIENTQKDFLLSSSSTSMNDNGEESRLIFIRQHDAWRLKRLWYTDVNGDWKFNFAGYEWIKLRKVWAISRIIREYLHIWGAVNVSTKSEAKSYQNSKISMINNKFLLNILHPILLTLVSIIQKLLMSRNYFFPC